MKRVIAFIWLLSLFTSVHAQSPLGKWKLWMAGAQDVTGRYTDFLRPLNEKEPCRANVIYIFTADGNIITNADNCPDSTKKAMEMSNLIAKWEISGNKKITISAKDKDIEPVTYVLNIWYNPDLKKRVMNWELIFGDDPDISNPEEIVRIYFSYQEL